MLLQMPVSIITSPVFAFSQQNPEYRRVFSIIKIKTRPVCPTCSHANGRMKLALHWKKNTPFSGKTLHIPHCMCEIMEKRGLFLCTNQKMCSSFSSSSSSCPSPTELCTSQVTNCTVNYSDIHHKILFSDSQKVTVRAEYTFGEVSSEHYEFESMKICKCHEAKNVGIMLLILTIQYVHAKLDVSTCLYFLRSNHQTEDR